MFDRERFDILEAEFFRDVVFELSGIVGFYEDDFFESRYHRSQTCIKWFQAGDDDESPFWMFSDPCFCCVRREGESQDHFLCSRIHHSVSHDPFFFIEILELASSFLCHSDLHISLFCRGAILIVLIRCRDEVTPFCTDADIWRHSVGSELIALIVG